MSLQSSIEQAQKAPDSPFAIELRKRIESGSMDSFAQQEGITLPGRVIAAEPEVVKEEPSILRAALPFSPQVKEAVTEVKEVAEELKFEVEEDEPALKTAFKAVGNIPADTFELGAEIVQLVTDPVGTAQGLFDFSAGIFDNALEGVAGLADIDFTPSERNLMVDAMAKNFKATVTDPSKLKKLLAENPADVLATISGVSSIAKTKALKLGKTDLANKFDKVAQATNPITVTKQIISLPIKAAGATFKGIAKGGAAVLGKTTGAGSEAIKAAFKQGGKDTFGKALRGDITDVEILDSARKGLEIIKEQRKVIYGKHYKKLIDNKSKIKINDVQNNLVEKLGESKVKITKDGKLDFSESTITQAKSQAEIQSIFEDLMTWDDNTPAGLDILKQRVQDRFLGSPETAKADRFSTLVGNSIKDKIISEVPEYAEMTRGYAKITEELRDITKTLSLGDKASKMSAITRLNQILKDNVSFRKEALDLLESASGIELTPALAGAALKDIAPKGLAGVIGGGIASWGLGGTLFTPAFISGALLSSPRVIGEVAKAFGLTRDAFKSALTKMKKIPEEAIKPIPVEIQATSVIKD